MTAYEQRCREMLERNAHNMSPSEIERFAYGAGDETLRKHASGEADTLPIDDETRCEECEGYRSIIRQVRELVE